MSKEELIQKLLEYKAQLKNTYCDLDDVISDVMSDVCDYDNDNDFELDSYTYYYETIDWIEEFIKQTLQDWWILCLKNRLSEVDWDYEWFHIDDVDWTIYPRDFYDVEEWIDDMLSELWYDEADSDEALLAEKDLQEEICDECWEVHSQDNDALSTKETEDELTK